MRTIAVILCIYFVGLIVQPVLFAMQPAQQKTMSCCKGHKGKMSHCPMEKQSKKGCCDNGNCNPLCSQCPVCGFSAITVSPYNFHIQPVAQYKEQYFVRNHFFTSSYTCQLLRPPQTV